MRDIAISNILFNGERRSLCRELHRAIISRLQGRNYTRAGRIQRIQLAANAKAGRFTTAFVAFEDPSKHPTVVRLLDGLGFGTQVLRFSLARRLSHTVRILDERDFSPNCPNSPSYSPGRNEMEHWPRHEMRYTLSPQSSLEEAHESAEPDDDVIVISSSSSSSNRRVIAPSPSRVDNNIDLFSLLNQHLSTRVDEFVNTVSHHVQAIVTALETYVAS